MINVFASLKALETLALGNRWSKILCSSVKKIFVYASNDEIMDIQIGDASDSPITNIVQSGDLELVPSQDIIDGLIEDHSQVLNYPSSIFFLDIPKSTAESIQKQFGVICKNENDINDTELSEKREISCENGELGHCWSEFLKDIKLYPTNSVIISDRYIFAKDNNNDNPPKREGRDSIIDILDAILPNSFSKEASYHILLLFSFTNNSKDCKIPFHKLSSDLSKKIAALRPYKINFELITVSEAQKNYELTHNRRIITNYHVIRVEHKIQAFKGDKSLCSQVLNWDALFSKGILDKSDKPYKTHQILIRDINEISEYGSQHATSGYKYSLNGISARNENKEEVFTEIKNRLIAN